MKATAKVAAVATALAMATSMLSLAPIAHAATFSTNLTVGSMGADVTTLQQTLIAAGYSIPAGATGYFGAQTKTAVAAWQKAAGISPAVGFFGPISRAALSGTASTGGTSTVAGCAAGAMFSSTTGAACTTTTTSTVAGCAAGAMFSSTTGAACGTTTVTTMTGSGRLTNISSYGSVYSDLKEGDAATGVVGIQADATGGDVAIQRVDAAFYVDDVSSQSTNLNQYVSDVSLYLNGTKLASMDPAMADKSGRVWTVRFSGLNGVVKSGTTGNLVVKVTPISSIGTTEDGKSIIAALLANSIRAIGADGISDTYLVTSPAVTQNSGSLDSTTGGSVGGQQFHVSSATTGTLTATAGADNPTASQIAVGSSTTTGVKLLSFNLKAKNAGVKITDLKAQFVTNATNLSDVVNTIYLMKGSTVLKSTTLSTGTAGFVTFTNVNESIAKDVTSNYTLVADLKGDASYADGTTLIASTTITGWDVSDTNGSSVSPSAAVVGNVQTLTAAGISVAKGSFTAVASTCSFSGCGDNGLYTMPFTVTAGDNDVFIGSATTRATTPSASAGGVNYATTTSSTNTTSPSVSTSLSAANVVTGDIAGAYKVLAGTSRTFTLSVSATAVLTGLFGFQITGINYGPTSTLGTTYFTSNLDTFKTNDLSLVKH
jgi:peptidoglycan hydrolase-like protein with peptidoglycan-binding domain